MLSLDELVGVVVGSDVRDDAAGGPVERRGGWRGVLVVAWCGTHGDGMLDSAVWLNCGLDSSILEFLFFVVVLFSVLIVICPFSPPG